MSREKFIETADRMMRLHLGNEARLILDGIARDRRIRVYRGLAPGERRAASIGHFLVVTASLRGAHPHKEIIPAGSAAVRHPSFDSGTGRGGWSVQTGQGTLFMPGEGLDGIPAGSPYLDNLPVTVEVCAPAEQPASV